MRLLLCLALVACSSANASPLAHNGQRTVATISASGRFTSAPACESGELTLTRSTIHVPAGGATVVKITDCNTAAGNRMAAFITNNGSCNATTDSKIGTNGDGGSDAGGTNIAIIAGSVPCAGSYVEVSDLVTGAVQDATIVVP